MLEYFVHIDLDNAPDDLVLVTAEIPDSVPRILTSAKQLPKTWRQLPSPPDLAAIGDEFVRRSRATVLVVPSALAAAESNSVDQSATPRFLQNSGTSRGAPSLTINDYSDSSGEAVELSQRSSSRRESLPELFPDGSFAPGRRCLRYPGSNFRGIPMQRQSIHRGQRFSLARFANEL